MLGDSVRRRQPKRHISASGVAGARRDRLRPLLWLAAALVLPLIAGYLTAVYIIFPPTEMAGNGISVPELTGLTVSEAQRELVAAGLGDMEHTELPSPRVEAGRVVAQSPLPGQQLRSGAAVRVALSTGPARVVVPDVLGFSAERAASMLGRAGFTVVQSVQESPAAVGRVIRTDPEPGQSRELPATVTLIVSSGPPAVPDSGAFPDTIPPPRQSTAAPPLSFRAEPRRAERKGHG